MYQPKVINSLCMYLCGTSKLFSNVLGIRHFFVWGPCTFDLPYTGMYTFVLLFLQEAKHIFFQMTHTHRVGFPPLLGFD